MKQVLLSKQKHRSQQKIHKEMLEFCMTVKRKSAISRSCNIAFPTTVQHLKTLEAIGCMEEVKFDDMPSMYSKPNMPCNEALGYVTTEKGRELLSLLVKLEMFYGDNW